MVDATSVKENPHKKYFMCQSTKLFPPKMPSNRVGRKNILICRHPTISLKVRPISFAWLSTCLALNVTFPTIPRPSYLLDK